MIQTAEDKVKEYCQCICREIEHWKDINQNGCNDPFWSDGCNMNLTRNHIIYAQEKVQKPRVERLRQLGRIMTGRIYQYDENQMSLF